MKEEPVLLVKGEGSSFSLDFMAIFLDNKYIIQKQSRGAYSNAS